MTDTALPTAGPSQPSAPTAHIEIPSEEESGQSSESESEEDEGPREKGKQIVAPTVEDEEQAAIQVAIAHSLADMAAPADPSATQPSTGEASSSQAPAPVLDQPEIPPPSVEVTPQTKISSVPASVSEGDPTITQPAADSHSA
ncbi:PREDICTED: predicted GPI-anchored protein 58 [Nicotiana attenuata]|uniref:predicted GPI-anchored protein 58 n=1 Tax=Nicotiana attenuata TaxID=49451 RepID=UPI000905176B|nr:PREDICTED: predicted GPI-anchored protein 58 [Nicotiana attenuata]